MIKCKSQQDVEKLKEELMENRYKNSDKVLELTAVLEEYAAEVSDRALLGFVLFYKGEAYYVQNEIDLVFENLGKAIAILSQTEQWYLLARAYNMLAVISINRGNAPVAVDYYLAALNCCKEHAIDTILCSIHINLGYLYMQNGIYREAQHHFDDAYDIYCAEPQEKKRPERLAMIYNNLALCYLLRGNLERTKRYVEKLNEECQSYFDDMDYVYVGCMKARYYHACGRYEKRDTLIKDILARLDKTLPILDLFDDLYTLCELALEIKQYDAFNKITALLEPLIKRTNMRNLERQLLKLQIRYYERIQDEAHYLAASGRFYQLVMIMEDESKKMVSNMIQIRTELERANESKKKIEAINAMLTEKSETDQLTGLANRYRLNEYSQKILADCVKKNSPLAVEILDIDYFKQYNDNYGHQAGDECIKAVAALLKNMQSETVFAARYGGDEFIVVYSGLKEAEVAEKAKKLKQDILELQIEHAYSKALPILTISQGICCAVPIRENKSWDYLHAADEYLYKVKKWERNGICIGDLRGNAVKLEA